MDLTKHPCCFCNTPCYRICWIGHKLACVDCFKRLAVDPVVSGRDADA